MASDAGRADQCRRPYDRWPLGRGFERYYGFLGGDTSQYYPDLVYDTHQVEPPKTPEEGYHLTPDLVDKAISFIGDSKQLAPDKPFFLYFATGAQHAPHHAPKEWVDRYKGQFDDGWDAYRQKVFARQKELGIIPQNTVLSRHDPDVQDWDKLSADERRLYARMMEVFAGFLEHTDHHIGRLIDFLDNLGELDNTLIMVISDNGASSEGGPTGSTKRTSSSTMCRMTCSKIWRLSTTWVVRNISITMRGDGRMLVTPLSSDGNGKPTAVASPIRSWSTGPKKSRRRARRELSLHMPSIWCPRC